MAYKQGIACGSSVAILIFSIILLAFYIGCTNTCSHERESLYSPIWTSVSGIVIAFIGIGMSTSKAEKKIGACFLALCIVFVLVTIGCTFLTLVAAFIEIFDVSAFQVQSPTFPEYDSVGRLITPSPSPQTSSLQDRDIAIILWLCMTGTAGVMVIISIVASCMFCCCQETPQATATHHLVLTSGVPPVTGQRVVVNNQEFVLQPAQPGTTTTIITGALPGAGDQPPPYSTVINPPGLNAQVPASGYSNAWATTSSTCSTGPTHNQAAEINRTPNVPPVSMDSTTRHEYMQLQQSSPAPEQLRQHPTAATNSPSSAERLDQLIPSPASESSPGGATEEEYSYIEHIDSNVNRERIPTPDEYYDDVDHVTNTSSRNTGDSTYAYASTENLSSPLTKILANTNEEYVNKGVQRPAAGNATELARPVQPEYLDILP